jgi:hypothetical protein
MSLTKINEKIDSALEAYRDAVAKESSAKQLRTLDAKVKALHKERTDFITKGAVECKVCDNPAIGIEQKAGVGKLVFTYFEIGCSVCKDRRVDGQTQEEAVASWNELNK